MEKPSGNPAGALADLDEHQLRDIGLTREDALLGHQNSYRAFAELNEIQHASEWVKFHRPAS